jgi:hypothetical protein
VQLDLLGTVIEFPEKLFDHVSPLREVQLLLNEQEYAIIYSPAVKWVLIQDLEIHLHEALDDVVVVDLHDEGLLDIEVV